MHACTVRPLRLAEAEAPDANRHFGAKSRDERSKAANSSSAEGRRIGMELGRRSGEEGHLCSLVCGQGRKLTKIPSLQFAEMGGPKIPWRPGRSDREQEHCAPDGRLPDGDNTKLHAHS